MLLKKWMTAISLFALFGVVLWYLWWPSGPSLDVLELMDRVEQGDVAAMNDLAYAYFDGDGGLKHNEKKAVSLWIHAASVGNVDAQAALGLAYEKGTGTEKDMAEAAKWYLAAAENGHPVAQFNIAAMLAAGTGTERNPVHAYKWFSIVAAKAEGEVKEKAEHFAAKIKEKLSAEELTEAEGLAAAWLAGSKSKAAEGS